MQLKSLLKDPQSPFLKTILSDISPDISTIVDLIEKNIVDDPPFDPKDGGLFRDGVDSKLDALRKTVHVGIHGLQNLKMMKENAQEFLP